MIVLNASTNAGRVLSLQADKIVKCSSTGYSREIIRLNTLIWSKGTNTAKE